MNNEQVETYKSVSLLDMYNGEVLTCNKLIALSYDGKTADNLVSEIRKRGGILASEAFIMTTEITSDEDTSDNLKIFFSDSNYDDILKLRKSKDYNKDTDFIVAKLSDDCDINIFSVYVGDKRPGLPNRNNSMPWFFIAKKPENLDKPLSVTSSCYDVVYKTAISSEAEFMWDNITEKCSDHYVMYATGMYGNLNAPKILKET